MPALPLDEAGTYVAAAYLVFLALILIYVAIMAGKLVRIARDLSQLSELAARRRGAEAPQGADAEAAQPAQAPQGTGEATTGEAVPR